MHLTRENIATRVITADGEYLGYVSDVDPNGFRVHPEPAGQHIWLPNNTLADADNKVTSLHITSDRVLEYGRLV